MTKETSDQRSYEALAALRLLSRHLPENAFRKLSVEIQLGAAFYAYCHLKEPHTPPVVKAANILMLDLILPEWRDIMPIGFTDRRRSPEVYKWRRDLMASGNCCAECGSKKKLEAHHIVRWVDAPDSRVDPANGKILCKECHKKETHGWN